MAELEDTQIDASQQDGLVRDIGSVTEADLAALPVKHTNELAAVDRGISSVEQDRIEN